MILGYTHTPRKRKRMAFTLAEVLITLGIIGVVAAIMIPTLITQYQKQQTVERLKKAYSEISTVFNKSTVDNGLTNTWDLGTDYSQSNTVRVVQTYILQYFSVLKDCGMSTTGECTRSPKYTLKNSTTNYSSAFYKIFLQDGKELFIALDGNQAGGQPPTSIMVYFDLNGSAQPNKMGKDFFVMFFTPSKSKAQFFGGGGNRNTLVTNSNWGCSNEVTGSFPGLYCGAMIMIDGWQIADDYPW